MVLNRQSQGVEHQSFFDIVNLLQEGDVLVMNDSRVIPARLMGRKMESPGQVELLLLEETQAGRWWSMVRPGKRVRPGMRLQFGDPATGLLVCEVLDKNPEGQILVQWDQSECFWERLLRIGQIPLPPYIERGGSGASDHDAARYQRLRRRDCTSRSG